MQPLSFSAQIEERLKEGAELVPVSQIPALRNISNSTRTVWCESGKLPVVQVERRFFTIPDLMSAALAAMAIQPKAGKAAPRDPANDLARCAALNAPRKKPK